MSQVFNVHFCSGKLSNNFKRVAKSLSGKSDALEDSLFRKQLNSACRLNIGYSGPKGVWKTKDFPQSDNSTMYNRGGVVQAFATPQQAPGLRKVN